MFTSDICQRAERALLVGRLKRVASSAQRRGEDGLTHRLTPLACTNSKEQRAVRRATGRRRRARLGVGGYRNVVRHGNRLMHNSGVARNRHVYNSGFAWDWNVNDFAGDPNFDDLWDLSKRDRD